MKRILGYQYRAIHQLPFCCVPAILQCILYRRGLDILDQESIGSELGLRIPEKFSKYFCCPKIIILPNNNPEFGTQIFEKKYTIQKFFDKYKLPLKISKQYDFDSIKKLRNFIINSLRQDVDIILRFNNKIFKKKDEKPAGHFSLIVDYNRNKKEVIIGDPEPPFFKKVSLKKNFLFNLR